MDCAYNIITANFSGGKTHATTARVYQWSRGIELCITGADNLPQTFKAHFSVQKKGGVATTIVGIDERVDVPNVLFTIGKDIHVWLGASETEDDAEILYTVDIPVAPAPMPEYYDAEDTGVFDAVVEQVSGYAATATAAANSAGTSATAAAGSASAAAASASSAAGSAGAAEQARANAVTAKGQAETAAQTATEKALQTAQNASQAALDAGRAESAAERAESAEAGAGAAKTAAEAAAQSAAASAATADEKATLAGQSATAAAGSASAAAQSAASIEGDVQIASQKAAEAQTAAGQAVTAKDAAVTAQTAAETAATNAGQSASTATAKAAEAAQSASGAAQSKTDAEAAAARAEQAAATLTVDSALSDSSTNPVQNKVVTAEFADVKSAIDALKITDTASGAIASFPDGAAMPMESLTVELEPIQEGTGDPSPDNIRPITGRESVTVVRTGVNVWDEEWEVGIFDGNGEPSVATDRIRSKNFCFCVPNTEYCFVIPNQNMRIYFYDADKTFLEYFGYWNSTRTFTTPAKACFFKILGSAAYGTTYNHDISINYPSTDHDYHAYDGQSATIQLGTTVYGGTVDVTTGVMTVADAMVDLGSLTWSFSDVYGGFFHSGGLVDFVADSSVCVSSSYKNAWGGSSFIQNNDCIVFINANGSGGAITGGAPYKNTILIDRRFTDAASLKAALSGVMLCYKLATPLTIQLTPSQLSTIKGQNNVWSDADSVSVEYVADPKLYIARLTEPDADMVADANITAGSYFMVGNSLYLATSNIASGAAITPGVNCTRTNLASALNAINA